MWARDERYVLMARNDGTEAKLFDLQRDPEMNRDVAAANPDFVRRMYYGYVVADAGGTAAQVLALSARRLSSRAGRR